MADQQKEGIAKEGRRSWKEGFDAALSNWRNAQPVDKHHAASNLLSFVGSIGLKLDSLVDDPSIEIDQETAVKIREDFKNK